MTTSNRKRTADTPLNTSPAKRQTVEHICSEIRRTMIAQIETFTAIKNFNKEVLEGHHLIAPEDTKFDPILTRQIRAIVPSDRKYEACRCKISKKIPAENFIKPIQITIKKSEVSGYSNVWIELQSNKIIKFKPSLPESKRKDLDYFLHTVERFLSSILLKPASKLPSFLKDCKVTIFLSCGENFKPFNLWLHSEEKIATLCEITDKSLLQSAGSESARCCICQEEFKDIVDKQLLQFSCCKNIICGDHQSHLNTNCPYCRNLIKNP